MSAYTWSIPLTYMGFYMQAPLLTKYGFRIRTRVGLVVDNLLIPGRDAAEAERKLRQIYRDCEILARSCQQPATKVVPASYEDVIALITR
jgi:hypothetical protein